MLEHPIFKDKRMILFVRTINGLPTEIQRKRIALGSTKVTFKKLSFIFDVSKPSFRSGRTWYYIVDIREGQLEFAKGQSKVSPELVHAILTQGIARQLVAGLKALGWGYLPYTILGILFGICLGYIMGNALPLGG